MTQSQRLENLVDTGGPIFKLVPVMGRLKNLLSALRMGQLKVFTEFGFDFGHFGLICNFWKFGQSFWCACAILGVET